MKKIIPFLLGLITVFYANAQTGFTTVNPASSSVAEMSATNKGVLFPRIALSSTDVATITSPAYALTVFNTATSGTVPNNVLPGYYYWNGAKWIRLLDADNPNVNIYNGDGTLTGNRSVNQGINKLTFESTASNAFSVDGSTFSVDAANDKLGIGTISPGAKIELASGTANISGLKFTNFNSATPIGTGQTLGVDATGNVITMPNPNPSSITTFEAVSTVASTFGVNNLGFTLIPNSAQTINIPIGGKALFVNFMYGLSYGTTPPNSGAPPYYKVSLFIDGVESNAFLVTQQSMHKITNNPAQFSIYSVLFLTAGSHVIDARMTRSYNSLTMAAANIICTTLSLSFNASYLN